MDIHQGLSRIKTLSITAIIAILFCSTGTALAAVQDGLVGVAPGFPQIDAPGAVGVGQQCSYDSITETLTIESTAQLYLPDANSFEFINNGLLTLTAMIDDTGNLTAGTLTITGTTNSGLTDPLMTGDLVALGMEDTNPPGGSDRGDFRATPTGGSVVNGPDWPGNFDITASFNLRNSTYSGSFAGDWDCETDRVIVGAEFFAIDVGNYIGLDQATAQNNIIADGLTVGVVTMQADATAPVGEVIGQDPAACTACASDLDPVDLTVSSGSTEPVEVEVVVNPNNAGACININNQGGVPVAILGHTVDITMIDQESLVFQGLDTAACTATDVNDDDIDDLLCGFVDDTSKWEAPSNGQGNLSGQLFNGTLIFGSGGICLVSGSSALSPVLLVLLSLVALFRRRLRVN